MNALLPKLAPQLMSRERLTRGLHQLVAYLRATGVTPSTSGHLLGCRAVGLYLEILGARRHPVTMVDGDPVRPRHRRRSCPGDPASRWPGRRGQGADVRPRELFARGDLPADECAPVPDATAARTTPRRMADDAREYRAMFRPTGRRAGDPHPVNGDRGLTRARHAGRLHGSAARPPQRRGPLRQLPGGQVDRIARLGAIVSANPYYTKACRKYAAPRPSGPTSGSLAVRSRSVLDRGVPLSFHSDLYHMGCAPQLHRSPSTGGRSAAGRSGNGSPCTTLRRDDRRPPLVADKAELGSIEPGVGDVHRAGRGPVRVDRAASACRWWARCSGPLVAGALGQRCTAGARLIGLPGHGGADDGHDPLTLRLLVRRGAGAPTTGGARPRREDGRLAGMTATVQIAARTEPPTLSACRWGRRVAPVPSASPLALASYGFEGKVGQTPVVPSAAGPTHIAVGIGERESYLAAHRRGRARCAGARRGGHHAGGAPVATPKRREAATEGLLAPTATPASRRPQPQPPAGLVLVVPRPRPSPPAPSAVIAEAACLARGLANTPPAYLTARMMAEAMEVGAATGRPSRCSTSTSWRRWLRRHLGVNRGSRSRRMVRLTYTPRNPVGHLAILARA